MSTETLKSLDHIINKLQTAIWELTSPELKLKDNIINKLINQKNCKENTNTVQPKFYPTTPRVKRILKTQIKITKKESATTI